MNTPLAGKGVLITRPAHQARTLADLVEAAGGRAVLFPAIEIRNIEDLGPFARLVDRLDEFDLAVFISPNAAQRAMRLIHAARGLPPTLRVAAIGAGGVRALAEYGIRDVISPPGRYDSEALLELEAITGAKRVVIFRGEGGREHLGKALRERGAQVEYAECYSRAIPDRDPAPLLRAWADGGIHAVTVTSSEGLRNFGNMIGEPGRSLLRNTPLFAPHPRIAEAARTFEVRTVVLTAPGDRGLLAGLVAHFGATA